MSEQIRIPLKKLTGTAVVPKYAYAGDAGVDLCATERYVLQPFERVLVSTGIAIELPEGYAGFVLPRSGLAVKHGISIVNAPGLIDSNYRGELKVCLVNLDAQNSFVVEAGDRIAQLVVMPHPVVTFCEVDELNSTERGVGGFGSSGVKA